MPAHISTFAEKAKELISLRSFPANWNAKKRTGKLERKIIFTIL
jgi:hypothetical protein